ncbi:hypothetical protein Golob_017726, partial [Gossypium lobatum]|nr:hypothetical protein [Gossypium lobatum]
REDDACVVWEKAKHLSQDFRIHNLVELQAIPTTPICKTWTKPLNDYIKINFDASVSNGKVSFNVIVRDSDDFVVGGSGGFIEKTMYAEWTEMETFDESLKVATRLKALKNEFLKFGNPVASMRDDFLRHRWLTEISNADGHYLWCKSVYSATYKCCTDA